MSLKLELSISTQMTKPLRNVAKLLTCSRKFHNFYVNIRKSIPLTFFWIDMSLTELSEYFEYSGVLKTVSRGKEGEVFSIFCLSGNASLKTSSQWPF